VYFDRISVREIRKIIFFIFVFYFLEEYVICKTCRSPDTLLQKEERLSVLLCNNCRSRYFVSGIKTGFQAQVGKRAATRAKAT
jgi:translation initiation factor 2 subunit 2